MLNTTTIKPGCRALENIFLNAPFRQNIPEDFVKNLNPEKLTICPNFLKGKVGDFIEPENVARYVMDIKGNEQSIRAVEDSTINAECLSLVSELSHDYDKSKDNLKTIFRTLSSKIKGANEILAEKYGDTSNFRLREISAEEKQVINIVQGNLCGYQIMEEKLLNGIPLSDSEVALYKRILNTMKPLKNDSVLWRSITEYPGLKKEITTGTLNFPHFTSCASQYDADFFHYWNQLDPIYDNVDDTLLKILEPFMLKIKVQKGTKVLQCNYNGAMYTKEVFLPPGKGKITGLDKEAGIIEMDYTEITQLQG